MANVAKLMASRSVKSINLELDKCRENLNLWFVTCLNLLKLKKMLARKSITRDDKILEILAKNFTADYYDAEDADDSDDSDDSGSDVDNEEQEDEEDDNVNTNVDTNIGCDVGCDVGLEDQDDQDETAQNDDLSVDLEAEDPVETTVVKNNQKNKHKINKANPKNVNKTTNKSTNVNKTTNKANPKNSNKTEMQNKALTLLQSKELEQAEMDAHMDARRKEMQLAQQKLVKSDKPVNFMIGTDASNATDVNPVVEARPDNLEQYEDDDVTTTGNNLNNTNINNKNNTVDNEADGEVLLEEEVLEDLDVPVDISLNGSQPIVRILSDEELAALSINRLEGTMGSAVNAVSAEPGVGTLDTSKVTNEPVNFITKCGTPPAINALLKISPTKRAELCEKLYYKAKENVERQIDRSIHTPEKIKKLIRDESDRLLAVYIKTH